jgi:hypothetical protein
MVSKSMTLTESILWFCGLASIICVLARSVLVAAG